MTPPLTPAQRRQVEEALPKLRQWAEEFHGRYGFAVEDCLAIGGEVLTECVTHLDPSKGVPLHVYAFLRVRGEILDTLGKERKRARLHVSLGPVAGELARPADPFRDSEEVRKDLTEIADLLAVSCVLSLAESQEAEILRQAMVKVLTREERVVVEMRHFEDLSVQELCKKTALSPSTAKRRHRAALQKLDREIRARGVER